MECWHHRWRLNPLCHDAGSNFKNVCLFVFVFSLFIWKAEGQTRRGTETWFIAIARAGPGQVEPGARSSTRVSHVGSKEPSTLAISCWIRSREIGTRTGAQIGTMVVPTTTARPHTHPQGGFLNPVSIPKATPTLCHYHLLSLTSCLALSVPFPLLS